MRKNVKKLFLIATFVCAVASAYTQTVSGVVSDEAGNPLIGVSVRVKEALNVGTITDGNGNYSVTLPSSKNVSLVFSYVGYKSYTEALKGRSVLNITLHEDAENLNELVVIGYGTAKKSDLTGSVTSVKSEDLQKYPAGNVSELLRGQGAGIQVTLNSAAPGGVSDILIRGKRSLSTGQSPLYIVDGMIVPTLNDLNSNDIENIEVLKDASAQAIYGSRAANGVILVSTKRGEEGKVRVDFSAYYATQHFQRNFDLYSPQEWLALRWWAKQSDGTAGIGDTPETMDARIVLNDEVMYKAYQDNNLVNWEKLMFGNAPQQKYDVNIRGGSAQLKYSASLGYFKQKGIVEKSGYERGTFRSNLDYAPYKWLDVSFKNAYTRATTQSAEGNFNQILTMPPYAQAFNDDGTLRREVSSGSMINPLWYSREYNAQQKDEYLTLNGSAKFKLFKGFSYQFSANIRSNNRETGNYKTILYPGSTGEGSISAFKRSSYLIDNVITYDLPISNKAHKVTATLIHSMDEDLQTTTGIGFINSPSDIFNWNIAADAQTKSVTRSIVRTRSISYAARLQYNLLDRYLVTASVRRDGASVFGPDNKWGTFPAIALAWRINEESFLKSQKWLDMLKLRLSYGEVGNWAIPAYTSLGVANRSEYLLDGNLAVGYLPSDVLLNKELKWETTGSGNIALDFSVLRNRIGGTIEMYKTNTYNLLLKKQIPALTSYNSMWDNLGQTQSSGTEVTLNGVVVDNKNIKFNLGASVSMQKNKIVKIDGRVDADGKPIDNSANNWYIGKPINVARDYVFAGIWQTDEIANITDNDYLPGNAKPRAGDIKLLDYNKDGKITTDDRKIYDLDPKWYGTVNANLTVKSFDLELEFYTVQGITKSNPYLYAYNQGGSLQAALNGMKVNYWTPDNPSNDAPRPQFSAAVSNFNVLGWQDASYFRLRTATLGYSFPKKWLSKAGITKARIYVTGTNMWTITNYKSYSPEKDAGGYPEPHIYTVGLNLSF